MARPVKNNADYFSHDADMRNDDKIKAVRNKFGHEGYAIRNMLLEKLCDAEYFKLEYSDLNIELWAGDFDSHPDKVKEIIEYFIKLGLIQKDNNWILSQKQINRFDDLMSKRLRDRERLSQRKQANNEVIAGDNPKKKRKEIKRNKTKLNILSKDNINNNSLELLPENQEELIPEKNDVGSELVKTESPPPTPAPKKTSPKGKRKKEVDETINFIKEKVEGFGFVYKAGKYERERAWNILTAKEFGNLADRYGITRKELIEKILNYSYKDRFRRGKLYNATTFYKFYADINNLALNEFTKNTITEIPGI